MTPLQPISPLGLAGVQQNKEQASEVNRSAESFKNMLGDIVSEVSNSQVQADHSIQQLHTGGEKHLHEAMLSIEQADITLRYMVQVRNKALEAYQEIMRMQV